MPTGTKITTTRHNENCCGATIEADETYIGGKAANRAYGPVLPKLSVLSLVERGGRVRSFHVANVTANQLQPIIARHVHSDSRFMTDEANVWRLCTRRARSY